jgi:hypothetical protein
VLLLFLRQVPGLRAVSKRKKKSGPNAPTRRRPLPIDRIATQRARRKAALKHNPDGNQPQQADLAPAPGSIAVGDQSGNIQPDDNLEWDDQGSPLPDAADDLYDRPAVAWHEEREEEEEANHRHRGEEQEQARIRNNWNPSPVVPQPIPGVTLTLGTSHAPPLSRQPLEMANVVVSPRASHGLILIVTRTIRN